MRDPFQIPGFQVLEKLGVGGFGQVYKALDLAHADIVALKTLLHPEGDALRRFIREAKQLHSQIQNPHVVTLFQYNMDNDPPFLVMEYCDAGSLRGWVEGENKIGWRDVTFVLMEAAEGIRAIHDAGGFHRDIKPDNLLLKTVVNNDGVGLVLKVADLGLARMPDVDESYITRNPAGTHYYMAPELLAGSPMTQAADVYSLGLTGVELLCGVRDIGYLEHATCPASLKKLLRSMTLPVSAERPPITAVISALKVMREPILPQPAPPRRRKQIVSRRPEAGNNLGALLLGGLVVVGGAMLIAALSEEE